MHSFRYSLFRSWPPESELDGSSPPSLQRQTTSRKRAVQHEAAGEHDPNDAKPPSKRPREGPKSLCVHCNKIDFGLLARSRVKLPLRSIEQALASADCLFCNLVLRTIAQRHPDVDLADTSQRASLCYSIESCLVPGEEHLQRTGVGSLYRVLVKLGRWYRAAPSSRKRMLWLNRPSLPLSLDFLHTGLRSIDGTASLRMVRRSIEQCIPIWTLREWLDLCDYEHHHDSKRLVQHGEKFSSLRYRGGFRLLDVKREEVVTMFTVPRYFTLSYVWGSAMTEYTKTLPWHKPGVPAQSHGPLKVPERARLPRTLREAMDLVLSLGERYLWVDALCIDQNNLQEKSRAIHGMAETYQSAYATIVAACGADADRGLAGLADGSREAGLPTTFTANGKQISLLPSQPSLEDLLSRTKWNSRAWTYQERLLSPRCIFFTENEVLFTCSKRIFREAHDLQYITGSKPQAEQTLRPKTQRTLQDCFADWTKPVWQDYADAVQQYTRRAITRFDDRLNAFKGIQERLSELNRDFRFFDGLGGLPYQDFLLSLQWRFEGNLSDHRRSSFFPSWSWADWSGAVCYSEYEQGQPDYDIEIYNMDEHNIVAKPMSRTSVIESWPFEPRPAEACSQNKVTLHLWVPVLMCQLVNGRSTRVDTTYDIMCSEGARIATGGSATSLRLGHVKVNPVWALQHGDEQLQEVILLPRGPTKLPFAMLIQRTESRMERVAARISFHDNRIMSDRRPKGAEHLYVQESSDVIMRCATYQHVRLR